MVNICYGVVMYDQSCDYSTLTQYDQEELRSEAGPSEQHSPTPRRVSMEYHTNEINKTGDTATYYFSSAY